MKWDDDALKLAEEVPVPPLMTYLVKLDAERRAIAKKMDRVTAGIVKVTSKGYQRTFGKEASKVIKAMLEGQDVDLPEEFFEEEEDELYKIEICPAKFGACTADKREMIRSLLTPLRQKLKELDITRVVMESARSPLMSHHVFRIPIIGCPNCCMSPFFSDFGIIAVYKPAVKDEGCIKCKACLKPCIENAITLDDDKPVIDYSKCVMCGGCELACEKDVIFTEAKGYKIVVGGTGSRHPKLAETVTDFIDREGVLTILEKAVNLFKEKTTGKNELSFHKVIEKYGVESLRN